MRKNTPQGHRNNEDGLPYLDRETRQTRRGVAIWLLASEAFDAAHALGVDPFGLQCGRELVGEGFLLTATLSGGYAVIASDETGLRRGLAAAAKGKSRRMAVFS